jgi:hypothetical protein
MLPLVSGHWVLLANISTVPVVGSRLGRKCSQGGPNNKIYETYAPSRKIAASYDPPPPLNIIYIVFVYIQ